MRTGDLSESVTSQRTLLRDSHWIGLVLLAYAGLTVILAPNYEQLPLGMRLYGVGFNTAVGAFNGFVLFDLWAARRRGLFLVSVGAVILAAALFHEAVVETYVFRIAPINTEGVYYSLRDAFWMSVVFIVLRIVDSRSRLIDAPKAVGLIFDPDSFLVKVHGGTRRLRAADVLYFKAERDCTMIVCREGKYFGSEIMKALIEKTAAFGVIRVHKSFAVNLNRVDRMGRTEAELAGHRVPIGRRYAREIAIAWKAMSPEGGDGALLDSNAAEGRLLD